MNSKTTPQNSTIEYLVVLYFNKPDAPALVGVGTTTKEIATSMLTSYKNKLTTDEFTEALAKKPWNKSWRTKLSDIFRMISWNMGGYSPECIQTPWEINIRETHNPNRIEYFDSEDLMDIHSDYPEILPSIQKLLPKLYNELIND